ncbi:MAG TPA: sulfite exporter TauE/SafE family protein [Firmicutes bacterium]|nr:sulfite exporter TauE/SafE family protein [Bacillota bacterium]
MIWKYFWLLLAGVAGGFINVNAGGGSLITLPLLIMFGLPPHVANGTNRIAVLFQNLSSVWKFKKSGYFHWKAALILGLPAMAGAFAGSRIALELPEDLFQTIIAGVMLVSISMILIPKKKRQGADQKEIKPGLPHMVLFLFIGLYVGFIQAGVGFLIIAALSLLGSFSLVRINSLKVMIILLCMIPSLLVFSGEGKIDLAFGIVLALGNTAGGWLGTHFAVQKGDRWIKVVLIAGIILMALKLLNISPL